MKTCKETCCYECEHVNLKNFESENYCKVRSIQCCFSNPVSCIGIENNKCNKFLRKEGKNV